MLRTKSLRLLAKEAQKYDTWEDFKKALQTGDAIYKGAVIGHRTFKVIGGTVTGFGSHGKLKGWDGFFITRYDNNESDFIFKDEAILLHGFTNEDDLHYFYDIAKEEAIK